MSSPPLLVACAWPSSALPLTATSLCIIPCPFSLLTVSQVKTTQRPPLQLCTATQPCDSAEPLYRDPVSLRAQTQGAPTACQAFSKTERTSFCCSLCAAVLHRPWFLHPATLGWDPFKPFPSPFAFVLTKSPGSCTRLHWVDPEAPAPHQGTYCCHFVKPFPSPFLPCPFHRPWLVHPAALGRSRGPRPPPGRPCTRRCP